MEFIRRIAQKEYDQKLLKQIQRQRGAIQQFLKNYDADVLEEIYNHQCTGRKEIIQSRIVTTDEYIREWYEKHPGGQNAFEMKVRYRTERGEYVRSKSEKILADMFFKKGIPYQYEPALVLCGRRCYPDFALLNVKRRKTLYWEHLGLIEKSEYALENYNRISDYEQSGYLVGRDVLFTMESTGRPLDINLVEEKLQQWLES